MVPDEAADQSLTNSRFKTTGRMLFEARRSIDAPEEYRIQYNMKTTLDIPDDLYRRVKARSALEGRPFRSVAIELLQNWLSTPPSVPLDQVVAEAAAPWLAITRRALRPGQGHDLESIRGAAAASWAAEAVGTGPDHDFTKHR